jgi:hypothetical protein
MLRLLDGFFTFLHLLIIGFNLLGWISAKTRKAHLVLIVVTALSWFGLGIWFGWGYCPITDWQWDIKQQLGETRLPNSFIKYYADKLTGHSFDAGFIDTITAVCFAIAAAISLYVNFIARPQPASDRK